MPGVGPRWEREVSEAKSLDGLWERKKEKDPPTHTHTHAHAHTHVHTTKVLALTSGLSRRSHSSLW